MSISNAEFRERLKNTMARMKEFQKETSPLFFSPSVPNRALLIIPPIPQPVPQPVARPIKTNSDGRSPYELLMAGAHFFGGTLITAYGVQVIPKDSAT